jgi:two-component sensor histidine kinase
MTYSPNPDRAANLGLAVLGSSHAPALLLDSDLNVIGASKSFHHAFSLTADDVSNRSFLGLGLGEWDVPQLRSLLNATLGGYASIDAYELDFKGGGALRRLVLNAQRLDYGDADFGMLLLTITDVTETRIADKLKDDLLREKGILLQEIQHRVANSLQIIASVLMQSARKVHSEETRGHLTDAHNRVMSIATVQHQLTASRIGEVELKGYFTQLCQSLGASMIHDHERLSIGVSVDDSKVKADVSVSLGLIVTELVINALKHAFPADRQGKINVDYSSDTSEWELSVSDDGIGTPEMLSQSKPGLGSSIVEALADQLGATIETQGADPGLIISIRNKKNDAPVVPPQAA